MFSQCSSTNVHLKKSFIIHDKDTVPKHDRKVFMNLLNHCCFYLENFDFKALFNILDKMEFDSQLS